MLGDEGEPYAAPVIDSSPDVVRPIRAGTGCFPRASDGQLAPTCIIALRRHFPNTDNDSI